MVIRILPIGCFITVQGSVGSALWIIGPRDIVKMCEKKIVFSWLLINFLILSHEPGAG
jgi:hypothetical protein